MLAHLGPNLQLPYRGSKQQRLVASPGGTRWLLATAATSTATQRRSPSAGNEAHPTYLRKIFADGLGGMAEVVAEGTGIAGLTRALSEEFARDV